MSDQPQVPWGAFPAEQYLIRNWDPSSRASPAAQLYALLRDFLGQAADGPSPREWDTTGRDYVRTVQQPHPPPMTHEPTQHEVEAILAPWRPPRWRAVALRLWTRRGDEEVWLRTYYGGGDDKFQAWLDEDEDEDPAFEDETRWFTILDDPAVFDFSTTSQTNGSGWSQVFAVLPELAGPTGSSTARDRDRDRDQARLTALRQKLRGEIAALGDSPSPEALADLVEAGQTGVEMQLCAVASFLFVADEEAFATDRLRLLYLDAGGDVVRESRVAPGEAHELRAYWNRGATGDSPFWRDRRRSDDSPFSNHPGSVLGSLYAVDGEKGRKLYGITAD